MQVFHTDGEPPSSGRRILPNIGCRINISAALLNKVNAKSSVSRAGRWVGVAGMVVYRSKMNIIFVE
jgi:hypothetical protein